MAIVSGLLLISVLLTGNAQPTSAAPRSRAESEGKSSKPPSARIRIETQDPRTALDNEYQLDLQRLIGFRSRPLDEVLTLSRQLEVKWRRLDWNYYAQMMIHVCSEISNRGLNDSRLRQETEHFARVALSHSRMFLWEFQTDLVGALSYQKSSARDTDWLRERGEKARFWLDAWHRLEEEADPSFDINNPRNRPVSRVYPPVETGLPAGAPPSAIKDQKLRAQYQAAIEANRRKSERANQQIPFLSHGPSFKARAERWLIQAYSQPPLRTTELKRYLNVYLRDDKARERILKAVESSIQGK